MVNRAKQQQRERPPSRRAAADRHLLRFVLEAHTDRFRYLESTRCSERGLDPIVLRPTSARRHGESPTAAALPPRLLRDVVTRAILVRDALEIWGVGADYARGDAGIGRHRRGEETTWCLASRGAGRLDLGAESAKQYRDASALRTQPRAPTSATGRGGL